MIPPGEPLDLAARTPEAEAPLLQNVAQPRSLTAQDLVALLARVAAQDREAFAQLYRATSAKLYGIVLRILSRGASAEEVLQDVYVRIWERAGSFDPALASPITWMATIARNRAIDELRRDRAHGVQAIGEDEDFAADPVDPLAGRERSEELQRLMACLGNLDEERRQILLLAYYRGLSRDALAQRFGRPVATIKTWLHRSIAQLRQCLAS